MHPESYLLSEVHFSEGIRSIAAGAFARCGKVKTVELPDSLVRMSGRNFGPNTVIVGSEGSYAESYAMENSLPFRAK